MIFRVHCIGIFVKLDKVKAAASIKNILESLSINLFAIMVGKNELIL